MRAVRCAVCGYTRREVEIWSRLAPKGQDVICCKLEEHGDQADRIEKLGVKLHGWQRPFINAAHRGEQVALMQGRKW